MGTSELSAGAKWSKLRLDRPLGLFSFYLYIIEEGLVGEEGDYFGVGIDSLPRSRLVETSLLIFSRPNKESTLSFTVLHFV